MPIDQVPSFNISTLQLFISGSSLRSEESLLGRRKLASRVQHNIKRSQALVQEHQSLSLHPVMSRHTYRCLDEDYLGSRYTRQPLAPLPGHRGRPDHLDEDEDDGFRDIIFGYPRPRNGPSYASSRYGSPGFRHAPPYRLSSRVDGDGSGPRQPFLESPSYPLSRSSRPLPQLSPLQPRFGGEPPISEHPGSSVFGDSQHRLRAPRTESRPAKPGNQPILSQPPTHRGREERSTTTRHGNFQNGQDFRQEPHRNVSPDVGSSRAKGKRPTHHRQEPSNDGIPDIGSCRAQGRRPAKRRSNEDDQTLVDTLTALRLQEEEDANLQLALRLQAEEYEAESNGPVLSGARSSSPSYGPASDGNPLARFDEDILYGYEWDEDEPSSSRDTSLGPPNHGFGEGMRAELVQNGGSKYKARATTGKLRECKVCWDELDTSELLQPCEESSRHYYCKTCLSSMSIVLAMSHFQQELDAD